jgi:CxxC motif-containing protein (DUF1111 family)
MIGALVVAIAACGAGASSNDETKTPAPPATSTSPPPSPPSKVDAFDVPIEGATDAERELFAAGDRLFELSLRDADGLGPLYTRTSCGGCHASGVRGPGSVQKMVVVAGDGVTPDPDQSALPWGHTVHPLVAGGGKTPIVPPNDPRVKVTTRVGPPILGRGYIEAIGDSEILRVAAEQAQRGDAIRGRPNHVVYASETTADARFHRHVKGDVVIGRFGLKARVATLDDFTADALQGDMGITSPLRPTELANPDALTDDAKPGVDVTTESVHLRAMYVRLTAIPARAESPKGRALFAQVKCAACHVPSMKTRADYPIAALAGIDAPIYSDLLLHDMGDALADGIVDGEAGARDWRTAPLIGLRFAKTFLHDSRATTIEQAILLHGGEAKGSVDLFEALDPSDKDALLLFVGSL